MDAKETKKKNPSKQKTVSKNVPKKLSPKEEADQKKFWKTFEELHDCFAQDDVFGAEGGLSELQGLIEGKFHALQSKVLVEELDLGKEITDKKKYILEVLGKYSVSEAVTFINYLQKAIDQHKYKKLKDLKVKGLEIYIPKP